MAWTPKEQVLDLTPLIDNILGFIETNDDDALAWASGLTVGETAPFAGIYSNASGRLATLFPQVMVLDQEVSVKPNDNQGDVLNGILALTFEGAVTGKTADETTQTAKVYAKAVESMLVNLTTSLIAATSPQITDAICLGYQTAHDQVKGAAGKSASSWLQIWQTRVEYRLIAEAFR